MHYGVFCEDFGVPKGMVWVIYIEKVVFGGDLLAPIWRICWQLCYPICLSMCGFFSVRGMCVVIVVLLWFV